MIFFILERIYKENILILEITLYIIFYVTRRTIHFNLRIQKIPYSSPPSSPPFIPFQIINHRCANSCIYQRSKVVSLPRLAQTNYNWGWWKGARRGGWKFRGVGAEFSFGRANYSRRTRGAARLSNSLGMRRIKDRAVDLLNCGPDETVAAPRGKRNLLTVDSTSPDVVYFEWEEEEEEEERLLPRRQNY